MHPPWLRARSSPILYAAEEVYIYRITTYNYRLSMMLYLDLALAILPGIVICYLIYQSDRYEKEPRSMLILAFTLGVLTTIPAVYIERIGGKLGFSPHSQELWSVAMAAFVVVGLTEELMKFLVVRYLMRLPTFNEPIDGIVYAVMVSMGFATLENILYVVTHGTEVALTRMFTAVPAHAVFGIVMGFWVGLAKFADTKGFVRFLMLGLLGATLLHGAYDFFLFQNNYPALGRFALAIFLLGILAAQVFVNTHQFNSPFRPVTDEEIEAYHFSGDDDEFTRPPSDVPPIP